MEAGPPIRAESDDLGGFRRTDGQRPTRSDSAISPRADPKADHLQ
jgi:hypothetical protein